MPAVPLFSVASAGLSGVASYDGRCISASLSGTVDRPAAHAQLGLFLDRIVAEALLLKPAELAMDVRQIEFVDTAGVRQLTQWVGSFRDRQPRLPCAVRFLTTERINWQKRSLELLRALSAGAITIESSS